MLQQLFAISRNTFVESIRQPIFSVMIFFAWLVLIVLNPSMSAYSMEHGADVQMLITMGLSTVAVMTLLLAAFTATGVIAEEIERKTVLTVVSKPVGRPLFILGKYLGVAAATTLAYYLMAVILLLTYRHGVMSTASDHFDQPVWTFAALGVLAALGVAVTTNYLYRWVFTSTFVLAAAATMTLALLMVAVISPQWTLQSPLADLASDDWRGAQLLVGLGVVFEAMLILTAAAVACSTRLGRVPTLLICIVLFLLGLTSNSLSGLVNKWMSVPQSAGLFESLTAIWHAQQSAGLKIVCFALKGVYMIVPNLQFLWPGEAIFQGHPFTLTLIAKMSLYAAMHIIIALCIAVMLFQRREVG